MLVKQSYKDVPTTANGVKGTIRIYVIEPNVPEYPEAKFPGCTLPFKDRLSWQRLMSGVVFSEIYQVTGPVERFASNIASEGYVVALPSSFHEFEGPEAIPYDTDGTDRGNKYKVSVHLLLLLTILTRQIEKTVEAYDEDATLSVDLLVNHPNCNGRVASTGMCLGGHLALRVSSPPLMQLSQQCAFDPRVLATFCYFATE